MVLGAFSTILNASAQDLLPLDLLQKGLNGLAEHGSSGAYDLRCALNYGDNVCICISASASLAHISERT